MCMPSATRAIEPNRRPPIISAIIMVPQSQITAHVLRSLCSWPAPKNTWECRGDDGAAPMACITDHSFEVGSDDFKQLLSCLGVERLRMLLGINQMRADVFLDYLR